MRRFSEPEKPLAQRNGPRSGGQGPQAAGDPYAQAKNGPYAGDQGAPTGAGRPGSAPGRKPPFTSRPLKIILWIILLVLLFPVLLGVGSGLLGILVGIAALLFGLFLLLGILTLAFLATGVFMIPFGVVVLFSQPAGGLMTAGTGLAFLGGGLLLLSLSLLFYGRLVPALVRGAVDAADRLIHKRRPKINQMVCGSRRRLPFVRLYYHGCGSRVRRINSRQPVLPPPSGHLLDGGTGGGLL